jgi:hypothetical protein
LRSESELDRLAQIDHSPVEIDRVKIRDMAPSLNSIAATPGEGAYSKVPLLLPHLLLSGETNGETGNGSTGRDFCRAEAQETSWRR